MPPITRLPDLILSGHNRILFSGRIWREQDHYELILEIGIKVEAMLVIVVLGYLHLLARIVASRLLSSNLSSPPDHGR